MLDLNTLISLIQRSQKTLFILCGFPYAGKSYVARKIIEQTNISMVSIDDIFYSHGFDWSTNTVPGKDEWQTIFNESYGQVTAVLEKGESVLYDSTNQTVESRDALREVARSVGADTKVIYIQSHIATVWKRWEENQKDPSRPVVSKDLVQMTIDMFEEPTESEDVIIVSN